MLAATFWRHVHIGALKEFQQALLHTFTAHVTCDGRVVGLASYLVDLVDKDNAPLRCLDIIVGHLE